MLIPLEFFVSCELFGRKPIHNTIRVFEMDAHRWRLIESIRGAFADVTLGDGIGLLQGEGMDAYEGGDALVRRRARDEKYDWAAIPVARLNACYSSLCFLDAEGMRFHLPAYLIADLKGLYHQDLVFNLTYFEHDNMSRFDLLSNAQRQVVREYLLFRLSDQDYDFDGPMIERALAEYWVERSTRSDSW